jgi:hypothetical protein
MPRDCAILNVSGPLPDCHRVDDASLAMADPSRGPCMTKAALPAEVLQQLAFEHTATLNEQGAINRFVRHLHVRIARKRTTKPARDLLRRPLARELGGNGLT